MDLEQPIDFKESLKLLNEKEVSYLLIRGYAVGILEIQPRTGISE